MDEVDRTIISQLQKDGRTTLKEIADLVDFSIMGVKKRVDRLIEKGILNISALVNAQKLGLQAALILIEIESSQALDKFLKRFRECPRVVNIFTTLGGYNIIALVIAEDQKTLKSISIAKCSLRSSEGIRRSEFYPIGNIHYSPFLSIRNNLTHREKKKTPCKVDCKSCSRYQVNKCVGCPATTYYRGIL